MHSNWQRLSWGDLATLEYGKGLRGYENATGRHRVYGTNGPIGWHDEFLYDKPSVIIGRKGAYRGVHYANEPFYVIDTAFYLKPKRKFDMRWAYYQLLTQDINGMDSGSAIPSTSREAFYRLPVLVPPLQEQQRIADLLEKLDKKINLNRKMNATLEQMAQALFKSWFVDFDPVKAKELVSKGILEIGDGYRAKNDELGEPGLPFIRVANLNNKIDTENAERLREESVAKAGTKISRVGDVAFTSKGTIGRFARVGETTERFVYSPQVCFWRSLNKALLHPAVLYCWMQSDDFKTQILAVAGQTDMAPYVSLRDQREMLIPRFPSTQAEIGAKLEPLLTRQSLNDAESRTLAALRDALLPKLISGQLRIPDAEKMAEAAL